MHSIWICCKDAMSWVWRQNGVQKWKLDFRIQIMWCVLTVGTFQSTTTLYLKRPYFYGKPIQLIDANAENIDTLINSIWRRLWFCCVCVCYFFFLRFVHLWLVFERIFVVVVDFLYVRVSDILDFNKFLACAPLISWIYKQASIYVTI